VEIFFPYLRLFSTQGGKELKCECINCPWKGFSYDGACYFLLHKDSWELKLESSFNSCCYAEHFYVESIPFVWVNQVCWCVFVSVASFWFLNSLSLVLHLLKTWSSCSLLKKYWKFNLFSESQKLCQALRLTDSLFWKARYVWIDCFSNG